VTNAVVTWTTEYYGLAVTEMRAQGRQVEDKILATFLRRTASLASSRSMSTAIEPKKLTYPSGYCPLRERNSVSASILV